MVADLEAQGLLVKVEPHVHNNKGRSGIKIFVIGSFFGPSKRRERPQRGAEPCVEGILVLLDGSAALRAFINSVKSDLGARKRHALVGDQSHELPKLRE